MSRRESVQMAAINDWPTQLAILKVMFNSEDLKVKYLDDENDEVRIESQNDYEFAQQIATSSTNSILRLILRNSRDEIIGKLNLNVDLSKSGLGESLNMSRVTSSSIDSMRSSIERISPPQPPPSTNQTSSSSSVASSRLLASTLSTATMPLTLVASSQPPPFTAAQLAWLETYLAKFKSDLVKEMSAERQQPRAESDLISFESESKASLESKVQQLFSAIFEARMLKRSLKSAYLEEELQSTGAFMAEFIKDQNMPDGSKCDPGVKFEKTWLIKNAGKLEWCDNKFPVKLVCIAGNILTEDDVDCVDVPETGVEQTASISVALVAPPIEGTYFSEWVLCCHGFKFGPRIWCTIQVTGNTSNVERKDLSLAESMYSERSSKLTPHRQLSQQFSQHHHTASISTEDVDDEFVVIPDCFDLDKKWTQKRQLQLQEKHQQAADEKQDDQVTPVKTSVTDFGFQIDDDISLSSKAPTNASQDLIMLASDPALESATKALKDSNSNSNSTSSTGNKSSLESSIERIGSDPNDCEVVKRGDEFVLSRLIGEKLTVSETRDPNIDDDDDSSEQAAASEITTSDNYDDSSASNNLVNSNITNAFGAMKDAFSNLGRPSYVGSMPMASDSSSLSPTSKDLDAKMKELISMGFANRQLNLKMLKKYNMDLEKVVQSILEIHDNDWALNR